MRASTITQPQILTPKVGCSFEWLGGIFDALGNVVVHKTSKGRRYISLRVNGRGAPIFKEAAGKGQFTSDYVFWATDNIAYQIACDILPYTRLQHNNIKALIEFYEVTRPLGYQLRIHKRYGNPETINKLEKQRSEAYDNFLRQYSPI